MSEITTTPVSLWRKIWAFRWLHFAVLIFVTLFMDGLSFLPAALVRKHYQDPKAAHNPAIHFIYSWAGLLGLLIVLLAFSAILCGLYVLLSRWLEQRHVTEFGRTKMGSRLGIGALIGIALLSLSIGTVDAVGMGQTVWNNHLTLTAMFLLPIICAPIFEELMFRGVWLRIIEDMYGSGAALFTSSLFFGLAHYTNPHSGILPAIFIAIEAGLLLGIAYIATRSLWFSIGIHFGWNFTEGDIFGAPDSGNHIDGFFTTTTHGNPLITGGTFGPEASIITPILCLIMVAFLYRLAVKRGTWVPLRAQHFSPLIWNTAPRVL